MKLESTYPKHVSLIAYAINNEDLDCEQAAHNREKSSQNQQS